jgi:IPT/TIG domain
MGEIDDDAGEKSSLRQSQQDGTIYKMTPAGVVTTVHNFDGTDGADPFPLIQDTSGTLYGTTGAGGDLNCQPTIGCGTAFSLSVGLGAFVETLPTRGKAGTKVTILGTNLTGASSVTFNGNAASFTVVSNSEITTTVPTDATSGTVAVATPRKTLKSNFAFHVVH